jgi:hypothetical protein
MVEEIGSTAPNSPDRLSRAERARTRAPEGADGAARTDKAPEDVVSIELRDLIERVKQADTHRKERVHEVLEKLQRGELLTSETVREAAERILREGV